MDKTTSEPLPLDSNGQENIRTTSSGQRWTRQHQSYFLWTAMDKTTSELLPLDSDGQENIRAISSARQRTRGQQSYFFWTAMHKTASELLLLDSNGQDCSHKEGYRLQKSTPPAAQSLRDAGAVPEWQGCCHEQVSFGILTSHQLLWVTSGLRGKGCHWSRLPQQTRIQSRQGCWCCSNVIKLLPSRRIKRDCRTTPPHQHKSLRDAGTVPSMAQLLP